MLYYLFADIQQALVPRNQSISTHDSKVIRSLLRFIHLSSKFSAFVKILKTGMAN
jgi:hypothetical protein